MNEKLSEYLNHFTKQKEAGLVIVDNLESLNQIKNQISQHGFVVVNSWQDITEKFQNGYSVCLDLPLNLTKEFYDLIAQYSARDGVIQIMDKTSMKLSSIQFDPSNCHLLLLSSKQNLEEIEKKHSLKDKVGLVERI